MRTALVLDRLPEGSTAPAELAAALAAASEQRGPLVLPAVPVRSEVGTVAALPFVVIQPARFGTSSLEQRVARAALALPPGGLFLVDAWLQPDLVGDTLDALSRVVFSLPAPPAAVVVFAPASERLFIAEQLIDAFILRTGVEDAFQREIAASLRTAAWLRWLGPRGQVVSGLLSGVSARVRRLLRR